MPHEVIWHDEAHSIVRIDILTEGSWDEIRQAVEKAVPMLASVPHRVDVIFNNTMPLPPGNPVPHLKSNNKRLAASPNMGLFVSVSPRPVSSLIRIMISIVQRVYGLDPKHLGGFVNTLDEAQTVIMKDRAKTQIPK